MEALSASCQTCPIGDKPVEASTLSDLENKQLTTYGSDGSLECHNIYPSQQIPIQSTNDFSRKVKNKITLQSTGEISITDTRKIQEAQKHPTLDICSSPTTLLAQPLIWQNNYIYDRDTLLQHKTSKHKDGQSSPKLASYDIIKRFQNAFRHFRYKQKCTGTTQNATHTQHKRKHVRPNHPTFDSKFRNHSHPHKP